MYEHKTPTVSLFVNIQGSSPLSLYLSTCVCVWLEGKNPLQSVVDDGADYVGEKKGERIRILLETKSLLPFFCPFFFFFFFGNAAIVRD